MMSGRFKSKGFSHLPVISTIIPTGAVHAAHLHRHMHLHCAEHITHVGLTDKIHSVNGNLLISN